MYRNGCARVPLSALDSSGREGGGTLYPSLTSESSSPVFPQPPAHNTIRRPRSTCLPGHLSSGRSSPPFSSSSSSWSLCGKPPSREPRAELRSALLVSPTPPWSAAHPPPPPFRISTGSRRQRLAYGISLLFTLLEGFFITLALTEFGKHWVAEPRCVSCRVVSKPAVAAIPCFFPSGTTRAPPSHRSPILLPARPDFRERCLGVHNATGTFDDKGELVCTHAVGDGKRQRRARGTVWRALLRHAMATARRLSPQCRSWCVALTGARSPPFPLSRSPLVSLGPLQREPADGRLHLGLPGLPRVLSQSRTLPRP